MGEHLDYWGGKEPICSTCAGTRHVEREREDGYFYDALCPDCTCRQQAMNDVMKFVSFPATVTLAHFTESVAELSECLRIAHAAALQGGYVRPEDDADVESVSDALLRFQSGGGG